MWWVYKYIVRFNLQHYSHLYILARTLIQIHIIVGALSESMIKRKAMSLSLFRFSSFFLCMFVYRMIFTVSVFCAVGILLPYFMLNFANKYSVLPKPNYIYITYTYICFAKTRCIPEYVPMYLCNCKIKFAHLKFAFSFLDLLTYFIAVLSSLVCAIQHLLCKYISVRANERTNKRAREWVSALNIQTYDSQNT